MKEFALFLALFLNSTGLWTQTDQVAKEKIASQALGQQIEINSKPASANASVISLPVRQRETPLELGAKSSLAVDAQSMLTLYSKNPDEKVPIASITKTVTALTILKRHNLDEVVTIKSLPEYGPEDDTMGLVEGDTMTVRQLIQAILIKSANDAADALAIWDAGSIPKFTNRMNISVREWGIPDTNFAGPSGLQDKNNFATATSLVKIGKLVMTNKFVQETVKTPSITLTSGQNRTYELFSTNKLLENGQVYGIKTGYTLASGECFLGITTINNRAVITVVLGSNDRFGDTVRLTNWIGSTYQWL